MYDNVNRELLLEPHLRRRLTPLQLQQLPDPQLHERLEYLKSSLTSINQQQQRHAQFPDERASTWKHAAEKAKQALNQDLSAAKIKGFRRTRPSEPGQARDRGHAFVCAAKTLLSKVQLAEIWQAAMKDNPQAFPDRDPRQQREEARA